MKKTNITPDHPAYQIDLNLSAFIQDAVENIQIADEGMVAVRKLRDKLLATTDWTQFNDVSMTDEQRTAWNTYRQALRDVPNNTPIVWPVKPS